MFISNIEKSPYDSRDYQYVPSYLYTKSSSILPTKVDLADILPPVKNQEEQGSCVEHGLTSACELISNIHNNYEKLSRQFGYNVCLASENRVGQDGLYTRDALEIARKIGFCLESEFTYGGVNIGATPSEACFESAKKRKLMRYESIPLVSDDINKTIFNIKSALAERLPVIFAMKIGRKYFDLKGPLSSQNYISFNSGIPGTEYVGNHLQIFRGYDDSLNYGSFLVRGSWDTSWGDQGDVAIGYTLVSDFIEAWAVKGFNGYSLVDNKLDEAKRKITSLYVSILGRAPDVDGLNYWATKTQIKNIEQIAQEIFVSEGARYFYPYSLSNKELITRFYVNILGRQPDTEGLQYWLDKLNSGASKGQIIVSMTDAALNGTNDDGKILKNKIDVGVYYSVDLACNNIQYGYKALEIVNASQESVEDAKFFIRKNVGAGII